MNIFLDKSLLKKTQAALQVLRGILLMLVFGGLFLVSFYPSAQNALLYISVGLALVFYFIKFIVERKKNKMQSEQLHNKITSVKDNDTTKLS